MRHSVRHILLGGQGGYDPLSLFGKYNSTGFYYDFTRPSSLLLPSGLYPFYQDQAATPVEANGDSIGLAIDQSQGAEVGAELTSSPDLDWDATSGNDTAVICSVTAGTFYRLQWAGLSTTSTSGVNLRIGLSATGLGLVFTTSTAASGELFFRAESSGDLRVYAIGPDANNVGSVTSWSVKAVSGNHGLQSTAAAKPTFRTGTPNVVRGDGVDDNLLSSLNPSTTMTLIEVGTPDSGSASDVLIGSQPASDGKAYLALSASGYLAGGVGTQATSTIVDSTSTDIRSVKCGKAVQWNGSTVRLFLKVAGGSFAKVYEAAQSGAVNTTIPFRILSLNNNGTSAASADTDTLLAMAISAEVNASDIEATMDHFLNL